MGIPPLSSNFGYQTFSRNDQPSTAAKHPSSALDGNAGRFGRTRRSNGSSDSDSDGGPSAKRPRTEPATDTSSASAIPDTSDDHYADYVQRIGEQTPLSANELARLQGNVPGIVRSSQNRLADQHSANTIRDTVLGALDRSPTFRSAVSYGIRNGEEALDSITYRNQYEPNDASSDASSIDSDDIQHLTIADLHEHDAQHAPIVPINETGEDNQGRPWISFSVAPDSGSPHMPSWQEGLIHEIMHHVTGSSDPRAQNANTQGPTEILARRVAQDMGWAIPNFTGYDDPARIRHLQERNLGALREAAARHEDHEQAFFERLDAISAGGTANPDFDDLGSTAGASASRNRTEDFPSLPRSPSPGLPGSLFFADSSPDGRPTGYPGASAAASASWETQGRFFQYGTPVNGNPHTRAFAFPDGSKVVAKVHEPMLSDSDGLGFTRFLTVAAPAAAAGALGFAVGGPPLAVAAATAAAATAGVAASQYDQDRVWQGYTLEYYGKGSEKPFDTQYMYAWDRSPKRVAALSGIRDPKAWPDYANTGPDENWGWWKWKAGNAPLRT